ncbi:MFS transporter, partial [Endobacter medicaginis]
MSVDTTGPGLEPPPEDAPAEAATDTAATRIDDASPLLHDRRLLAFFTSRTLTAFASQMQAVAVGWEIYALTGRPLSLGLVGLAQFLPVFSLVFIAGHAVDRFDRRRIAMICQLIEAAGAATLAVGAAMGWLTPLAIYALVAVFGAARTFEGPSLQ